MKECRFQLTYIADGQLHRTCGKAQAQQPFETEYFSLMTQYDKGRVHVRILPKEPVSFTQFEWYFIIRIRRTAASLSMAISPGQTARSIS